MSGQNEVKMSSNKEMIKVIEVLNKLQDKLVTLGVTDLVKELPQIAVVGSQSAGKSSVLESFVGRDFLPRGSDIVTRRPLILQLKHNKEDSENLSTSDAIKLARDVDPNGDRTIGVLTKLDLMNKGTDARKILLNRHNIKVKRGFIGVICRSPKDVENNKDLSEAMADEKTFFTEHSAYRDIMDKLGIENLQRKLQNELAKHLFKELPTLRDRFSENLLNVNDRIEKISLPVKEMYPNELISDTVRTFSQHFRNEIGTGDDVPVDRNNSGANINVEMNVKYAETLETIIRDEKRIKTEIAYTIKNIFGTRLELFVPNKAFSIVIKKQLELMRMPSLSCVDYVCHQLEVIVCNSVKQIGNFPKLIEMYTNSTLEFLRECKKRCLEMIDHKLDLEKAYLSATHMEFIKSIQQELKKTEQSVPITTTIISLNTERSGWIICNNSRLFFVLQGNHNLYWYTDMYKSHYRGSMNLKDVKITIAGDKYLLLKKNNIEIELNFESNDILIDWVKDIIERAYHYPKEVATNGESEDDNSDTNEGKYPVCIDSQVEEVKRYVLAYVKVMEQTLQDTLPKLCQKELIDAVEQFIGETLRNRIQNKGFTIDDLVDRDPHEDERKNLRKRQSLYEEALKTMNEVMNSSTDN